MQFFDVSKVVVVSHVILKAYKMEYNIVLQYIDGTYSTFWNELFVYYIEKPVGIEPMM